MASDQGMTYAITQTVTAAPKAVIMAGRGIDSSTKSRKAAQVVLWTCGPTLRHVLQLEGKKNKYSELNNYRNELRNILDKQL